MYIVHNLLSNLLFLKLGKLSSEVKNATGSRLRESLLSKSFLLPVCHGDTISPQVLQVQVHELELELTSAMEELCVTRDAVIHMKEQVQKLIVEREIWCIVARKWRK